MSGDILLRVRNYHLDGYGHVNNARYLEFLEEARWQMFERHGLTRALGGVQAVVVRADIRYLRGIVADDLIAVRNSVLSAGDSRILIRQKIILADSGKTAAQARITLAAVSDGRSTEFPAAVLHTLQQMSRP